MTIIDIERQRDEAEFARRAVEDFRDNPRHYTFAECDPEPGKLLAIRWNSFSILVIRLSDEHPVLNYGTHQFIQADLPPMVPPIY